MKVDWVSDKDKEIIALLQANARISYTDIAEKIGVSRTAVKKRILNLEQRGIIGGYRTIVNIPEEAEKKSFVVNIETRGERFDEIKRKFAKATEVVTLIQISGECRLFAVCTAEDVDSMRDFINRFYEENKGIRSISANSVIDVIKGKLISE